MMTSRALETLTLRLNTTLSRWEMMSSTNDVRGNNTRQLVAPYGFMHLAQQAEKCCEQLDNRAAPPSPPMEQRRQALLQLRTGSSPMTIRSWRLVAWGLSDTPPGSLRVMDDTSLFSGILHSFKQQMQQNNLSRRVWFGLLSSYFSYRPSQPLARQQWEQLRDLLAQSFDHLRQQQKSPRRWISFVEHYRDIISDEPGKQLAIDLSADNLEALELFRTTLPITDESWFWKSLVSAQLELLTKLSDTDFLARITPMLTLASMLPLTTDAIYAGLLTRYANSAYHDQAHRDLKDVTLQRWGSPQLGASRNRWSINVTEHVCRMVVRWFAKEDLETFFNLLQGSNGVDQDRLDYWLRFVGQIGFTRLVLGQQAMHDTCSDFAEFRQKNKGRISELQSGKWEDNAFIMQIGPYVIVEFSKKNNACYFRPNDKLLPFELNAEYLHVTKHLKRYSQNYDWLSHAPSNRGWWRKYDQWFSNRGIYPDDEIKKHSYVTHATQKKNRKTVGNFDTEDHC